MTQKIDRRTFLGGAAALGARMLAARGAFEVDSAIPILISSRRHF